MHVLPTRDRNILYTTIIPGFKSINYMIVLARMGYILSVWYV